MRGFSGGSRRAGYTGPPPPHICPETGEEVSYFVCASRCPKHGVHVEGDMPRCVYEYEQRKSDGLYAKTHEEWLEHLHDTDPEKWQRLVEEEKEQERVRRMIDADWFGKKVEVERGEEPNSERNDEGVSRHEQENDEKKHNEDDDDETSDDFEWDDDDEEEEEHDEWW